MTTRLKMDTDGVYETEAIVRWLEQQLADAKTAYAAAMDEIRGGFPRKDAAQQAVERRKHRLANARRLHRILSEPRAEEIWLSDDDHRELVELEALYFERQRLWSEL